MHAGKNYMWSIWVVMCCVDVTRSNPSYTNGTCRTVVYHVQNLIQTNTSFALEDLRAQFAAVQSKLQSVESTLGNKITILENKIKTLEEKSVPVQRKAFHAEGTVRDIPLNSIIKFGSVLMNVHGGYDPTTSKFTCNDRGLYLFYVTMVPFGGQGYGAIWYQIVQDGSVKAKGFTGYGNEPVSTHFAMIRCHPGSKVWVKQGHGRPSWKQGMWEGHSQFGGFEIAFK